MLAMPNHADTRLSVWEFPVDVCAAQRLVVKLAGLAIAYFVAAQIGFAFALVGGNASPIWPPAGIAAATLVVCGRRASPGVLVGACVTNIVHGAAPLAAVAIGVGATAEAVAAAELVRRADVRPQLDRLRDVPALAGIACLAGGIGATIGVGALSTERALAWSDLPLAWTAWGAGDALSILVLGGAVLAWAARPAVRTFRTGIAEAVLAVGAVAAVSSVLFFDVFDLRAAGESVAFPIIPVIVGVAFRIGPRGTTLALLTVAVIAVVGTDQGLGPLVGSTREASLFYAVGFIALTALTGLAVAAVVDEREVRADNLREATGAATGALERLQALEAIGRRLAEAGPTSDSLDGIVALLNSAFGYEYPSIYLGDTSTVTLRAQRGYATPIASFDRAQGVVGRVMRTGRLAFLPHVAADRDFVRADPGIESEISVPLIVDGAFLGVLSVESRRELDERDVASVTVVADRVAAALALARERQNLAERAVVFQRIVAYSEKISAVLDETDLYSMAVTGLEVIVPADRVSIATQERTSGDFVIRACEGLGEPVGAVVDLGRGPAGAAIAERRVVRLENDRSGATEIGGVRYAAVVCLPLLREERAIGEVTIARRPELSRFTDLEIEALGFLANEIALALVNAQLHRELAEQAIHDPLTGLHNRRYFDAALVQLLATRARAAGSGGPVAAIMFDLDNFGDFNLRHGHQIGDEVLRTFARILLDRLRGTDLVARYGGEEFIVILPGASRKEAFEIADQIRETLRRAPIAGVDGAPISVTVSAGCAVLMDGDPEGAGLIRAADVGLLQAKRTGRNTVIQA